MSNPNPTQQQQTITANVATTPGSTTNLVATTAANKTTQQQTPQPKPPQQQQQPSQQPQQPQQPQPQQQQPQQNKSQEVIKASMDELLQPIFYFPGMRCLVGSALSEGVYVSDKLRDVGLEDFDDSKVMKSRLHDGDVVKSVKNQVTALTSDFKGLQNLLNKLPTFISNDSSGIPSYHRSQDVDEPIHGEFYFPEIQKFENINAAKK